MLQEKGFAPIVIIIAVLVVIGGGYAIWSSQDANVEITGETTDNDTDATSDAREEQTLRSVIGRGENVVCTFSSEDANAKNSGTVYVSGDDMRGDFVSVTNGTTFESHMIEVDGFVYTWSSAMAEGFKMPVGTTEVATDDVSNEWSGQSSFDYDASYDYDCDGWSGDNSKFSLPAGVEFVDVSTMFSM